MDDDVRVRPVRGADAPELERLYRELSETSHRLRFHSPSHQDAVTAMTIAGVDRVDGEGFVATQGRRIVGHAVLDARGGSVGELAVVVDDRVQRRGVGTLLMIAAFAWARLHGIHWIVAWVLADNLVARRLLEGSRHPVRRFWEGSVARYEIELPPAVASRR